MIRALKEIYKKDKKCGWDRMAEKIRHLYALSKESFFHHLLINLCANTLAVMSDTERIHTPAAEIRTCLL